MKYKLIYFIVIVFSFVSYGQKTAYTEDSVKVLLYSNGTWTYAQDATSANDSTILQRIEIPFVQLNDEIVTHYAYELSYNESHEEANWVAYELTKDEIIPKYKRTNKFIPDPKVPTGSADDADYVGSGYDRGHLAPAADMAWSKVAMAESFYFSNMTPQVPGFNRGVWKRLEELVRKWAKEYGKLYIVTGPVLSKGLKKIGHDSVSVPEYFYKVILVYSSKAKKAIGFIIKNESSNKLLKSFAIPVDSVEAVTNLDFYPLLPDDQEIKLESKLDVNQWDFDP